MATIASIKEKLTDAAHAQQARYAGAEERPLRGYAITMATYAGLVGGLAGATRVSGRTIPERLPGWDVALCAAATHKLSRLLAKDPVTSPLRVPFTSYEGTAGPAELNEQVRGNGGQKTVGELVTCPFCISVWVGTGLVAGQIFLPRTTRLAMATLAALAGADMLQFAHAWLEKVSS